METKTNKATGEGETMTITIGTEIFNTGDRANHEHFGVVTSVEGGIITIQEIDDPAHTYKVDDYMIGDCGPRIFTKATYLARRKAAIAVAFNFAS